MRTRTECTVAILWALIGFWVCVSILARVQIVLYPDTFSGHVYVDEDGHRYTYDRVVVAPPRASRGDASSAPMKRLRANGVEFDAVCFGGGSLQTVAYLTEISALERRIGGSLHTAVRAFAGSSAGALIAIACAAGMSSLDLGECMVDMSEALFAPSIATMWRKYGLDDGTGMDTMLSEKFGQFGIDLDQTIGAFQERYRALLYIYAVDASKRTGVFMPTHCSLRDAIHCSTAIPGIYCPCWFENRLYLDGSFLNCTLPSTLPATHKWLWMRVLSSADGPAFTRDGTIEAYMGTVLSVVRAPADMHMGDAPHVFACDVPADERVPFIVPRMQKSVMRAVRTAAHIRLPSILFTCEVANPEQPEQSEQSETTPARA
ncbi:acyl transferase/acyl hydrolase/lysophospholipase [Pavlovales sp. CCMP2436]|nr:acyl transferase/acyl hydrolase/lysophospholipase [Pavlovales sp. CCMP2436]